VIDKHTFIEGLNVDTSPAFTKPSEFRNAENIRFASSYQGEIGQITPVEGNRIVTYASIYPIIRGQVVGAYEDRKDNRIYYFVWSLEEIPNANSQITATEVSKILCLDMNTNTVTPLVLDYDIEGSLKFRENSFIACAYAAGRLYFTDNINEPRKLEVQAILDEDFSVSDVYDLGIGAIPGHFALGVEKVNAVAAGITTRTLNNTLIDSAFQFSYRYLYEDNSSSTLAPYSKLLDYEDDDGEKDKDAAIITLPFNEVIPNRVRKIQFCAREGNTGDFFIFEEIDNNTEEGATKIVNHRAGTANIIVNFFNDRLGVALSREYSAKAFDSIPLTAKALDIGSDRVFMGNITLGYTKVDAPSLTVSFADAGTELNTLAQANIYYMYYSTGIVGIETIYDQFAIAVIDQQEAFRGIYYIAPQLNNFVNTFVRGVPTTQKAVDFVNGILDRSITEVTLRNTDRISTDPADVTRSGLEAGVRNELLNALGSKIGATLTATSLLEWELLNFAPIPAYGIETDAGGPTLSPVGLVENKHFKSGGRYKVGVVFYDKYNRNAGVSTNESCIVDIPVRTFNNTLYYQGISWDLTNSVSIIPDWATHYGIVRTKNLLVQSFIQTVVYEIKYAEINDSGEYVYETTYDEDNTIGVAINIDRLTKENLGYIFTQGDRIRMVMNDEGVIEAGVIGQSGKYIIVDFKDELTYSTVSSGTIIGKLEIFTPAQESYTEGFFEVGDFYPVINPGTADRNFSVYQGSIAGDVHLKERTPKTQQSYKVEAMSINDDKWQFWLQDTGRINIVLQEDGRAVLPNSIVYSNAFIQETKINGLSSYDVLDKKEVDERGGEINFLQYTSSTNDSENILLCICANNTHSLYIGQTRVVDDAGNSLLATSGSVIGTINTLRGDYGTQNPESVVMSRAGTVYWFDNNKKELIRYTSNGLAELGKAGVSSYLKVVGRSGNNRFVAGFDPRHNEYLINFQDNNDLTRLEDQGKIFIGGFIHEYTEPFTVYGRMNSISRIVSSNLLMIPPNTTYTIELYQANTDSSTFSIDNVPRNIVRTGNAVFDFSNRDTVPRMLSVKNSGKVAINILSPRNNWHDATDNTSKCLVFSEALDKFIGFRTFSPDFMVAINNNFVSFNNGDAYIHDTGINTFYGTRYDSSISFVSNVLQTFIPIFRGVMVGSLEKPKSIHIRTENPNIQSSDIQEEDFTNREGIFYAEVKRNRLFPNNNYELNLVSGETIKGDIIYIRIVYNAQLGIDLRYVNLKLQQSLGHTLN
jgi:hypothetical protein